MIVAGMSFGVIGIIRPTYGLMVAILSGYLLFFLVHEQQSLRLRIRDVLLLAMASGMPLILFFGLYAYRGTLPTLINLISYLAIAYPELERSRFC